MRLSSSLQDLPTFTRIDALERGSSVGSDLSSGRPKPVRMLQRDGAVASFSKERTPPSSPTNRKKCMRAAGCAIALILLVFFAYGSWRYFHVFLSEGRSEYYVVLDCGSTGNAPKKKSGKLTRLYQRMETEPGLSKLVHNESGLKKAIEPLLQMAEKLIPRHAHKHTPLFLYATAGVRKLPSADSEWLLDKSWDILNNSSFLCSRDRVKIISGMDEAYYGWIALNHNMDMLGTSSSKMTYGSLDLGGSSLQVTFENDKSVQDETSIRLSIGSVEHHLSAYSLTGYGLNDAFDKSVAHLVKRLGGVASNGKVQVKHPCLQTGFKEDYICSYCHPLKQDGSPSVGEKNSGKEKQGIAVELVGAPQWNECSALAKVTVNLSEWSSASPGLDCNIHPCALASNFPRPYGQFFAISGFYVVFKFFNLTADATLGDVQKRGQEFCEKPWKVAKSSVPPQPFVEQYCFRAPYISSLLREGLQIKDSQVIIGSGSITWTHGVALLEAGQALSSRLDIQGYRILHREINPNILIVLFLISIVLVICAILCVSNSIPRSFRKSYLPIHRHNSGGSSVLGDGRTKTPLSPTVAGSDPHPFAGLGGSSVELMESSRQSLGAYHSYSVGSLGQMQFSSGVRNPSRGQTTLQSRRSQSREDLSSSLADIHFPKV
ncbi:Putative nucleoside phosphatase GDA1/CD39 family protein [Zea mays]|uniref:Putative nucleoside phosphatase GDA1/CD39 family protein n=1 Tax=Zea mays TaxID=4577 RepID=A0A1D6M660_MAIZE|nr:Putative nucleoside phosphatase GDA1/CD39 family protein [Zea mays]